MSVVAPLPHEAAPTVDAKAVARSIQGRVDRRVIRSLERLGISRVSAEQALTIGLEHAVHTLSAAYAVPIERLDAALAPAKVPTTEYTWVRDFPSAQSPRMTVAGLLEAATLAVLYGDSNTGKSTVALDLALPVSMGIRWRGRRTTKGIVLWLALESAAGLRRRVAAYCKRHNVDPGRLLFADITAAVQLLELQDVTALVATIKAAEAEAGEKCVLVVIDTVARAMAGADEKDGKDMGLLVQSCDRVRQETGATVLLIHHSGKDPTKGARGHSSLRAAVDTEIEVSGLVNPRQAKVTKQRDLPCGDTFAFDLEPVEIGTDEETGEPVTACVVVHRDDIPQTAHGPRAKSQTDILRSLRNRQVESLTPLIWTLDELRKIGRDLGQPKGTARSAVDALVLSGLLTPTIGGHKLKETQG